MKANEVRFIQSKHAQKLRDEKIEGERGVTKDEFIENLIKNGIDAMKGKGVLHIQLKEHPSQIEVLIQDSGSGMKKELASKIFKPGFTPKRGVGDLVYPW